MAIRPERIMSAKKKGEITVEVWRNCFFPNDKSEEGAIVPVFVSDIVAARLIGSTPATLRRWRYEGRHLRYFKVGSSVRYKITDLTEFLASHVIETTRQPQTDEDVGNYA